MVYCGALSGSHLGGIWLPGPCHLAILLLDIGSKFCRHVHNVAIYNKLNDVIAIFATSHVIA